MLHQVQKRVALYPKQHNAYEEAALPALEWPWHGGLPAEWRDAVVEPLGFRRFHDYEAAALRVLGSDESDQPCYSHYQYRLSETRSDDDEDFYEETLYAEWGTSWRLRDGRWLTFRQVGERGFFSFSEEMPR